MISESDYIQAVAIYLKHAYPNDPKIQAKKQSLTTNAFFWDNGEPPSEYRFGCIHNPHMKLRVRNGALQVDTNAFQDTPAIQQKCGEIKVYIEREWKKNGFPVYHRE